MSTGTTEQFVVKVGESVITKPIPRDVADDIARRAEGWRGSVEVLPYLTNWEKRGEPSKGHYKNCEWCGNQVTVGHKWDCPVATDETSESWI